MLKAKDKIFTNLYGDHSYSLKEAQLRGDWDQTCDLIKKGSDWIIDEVKKSELRGRGGAGRRRGRRKGHAQGSGVGAGVARAGERHHRSAGGRLRPEHLRKRGWL